MTLADAADALTPPDPPQPFAESVADAFAALAQQRQSELTRAIKVPRYTPPIGVLVRPISEDEFNDSLKQRAKAGSDYRVLHGADLLARACKGIFLLVGTRRVALNPDDPDGDWPTFGIGLQPFLGFNAGDEAVMWVRALFRTDADVISAAEELVSWSGYANAEVREQLAGE